MSIPMGICPKCANFKANRKCKFCDCQMILTETTIEDVMGMSERQKEALIQHYIDTLIKDTFDPKAKKYREANEKSAFADYVPDSTPKCPTCGSTNISKISTLNRAVSVGVFGLASSKIGKTHKCNNCGSTW